MFQLITASLLAEHPHFLVVKASDPKKAGASDGGRLAVERKFSIAHVPLFLPRCCWTSSPLGMEVTFGFAMHLACLRLDCRAQAKPYRQASRGDIDDLTRGLWLCGKVDRSVTYFGFRMD